MHVVVVFSPTLLLQQKETGGTSSKDFVSFMEGLQNSRNIVADPSRGVSMATYTESNYSSLKGQQSQVLGQRNCVSMTGNSVWCSMITHSHVVFVALKKKKKEPSPELSHLTGDLASVNENDPEDIFSRESRFIRSNSSSRSSTLPRPDRNASLRRSKKPSEINLAATHSQTNLNDPEVTSPSHVRHVR